MQRSIDLRPIPFSSASLAHVPITASAFFPSSSAVTPKPPKCQALTATAASPRMLGKIQRNAKFNLRGNHGRATNKRRPRRMVVYRRVSLDNGMVKTTPMHHTTGEMQGLVPSDPSCDPLPLTRQHHWASSSQQVAANSMEALGTQRPLHSGVYQFAYPTKPQSLSGLHGSSNSSLLDMIRAPSSASYGATTAIATPSPFPNHVSNHVPATCSPLGDDSDEETEDDDLSSCHPSIFDEDLQPSNRHEEISHSSIEMPRLDELTAASRVVNPSGYHMIGMEQQLYHQAASGPNPAPLQPCDARQSIDNYRQLTGNYDFSQFPTTVGTINLCQGTPVRKVAQGLSHNARVVSLPPSPASVTQLFSLPFEGQSNAEPCNIRESQVLEVKRFFEPTDRDVMMGRGAKANCHEGNKRFRKAREEMQQKFLMAENEERHVYAHSLVKIVHEWGGKFLEQDKATGNWYEVDDQKARVKALQALRDGKMSAEDRSKKQQKYREELKALRQQQKDTN